MRKDHGTTGPWDRSLRFDGLTDRGKDGDGSPGGSPHRHQGMAERAELGTPLGQAEACTTNGETDGSPGSRGCGTHRVWVFER